MIENLTALWEERRLLVILVVVLAFSLLCLCGVVAGRFLTPVFIPAEIGQASPVAMESPTPTLSTRLPQTPTLPVPSPTATRALFPLRPIAPTLSPTSTPTQALFPLTPIGPAPSPTPTAFFPLRPIAPTLSPTSTPTRVLLHLTPAVLAPSPTMTRALPLLPTGSPTATLMFLPAPPTLPTSPLPPPTPTIIPTPLPGMAARILIAEIHPKGPDEYIVISNQGNAPQDMSGWWLRAEHAWRVFSFPPGFILQPGESVRIHSGPGALDNPPSDLRWGWEEIWEESGDVARLYNATNNLSFEYYY